MRLRGDVAILLGVSAAALNRIAQTAASFWKAISGAGAGKVKTTWKQGTGSSSPRSASGLARHHSGTKVTACYAAAQAYPGTAC